MKKMFQSRKTFKDRDYILTVEDIFFTVVGYVHPPNRVVAYPKYAPEKRKKSYRRVLPFYTIGCLKEALAHLKEEYPEYLYVDENGLEFSAVPLERIKTHYCPEKKVEELLSRKPKDELEALASKIVLELSKESGVPIEFFGLTGSILIGLHHPKFSDVDITVYGRKNSLKVKETILNLYEKRNSNFKKFSGEILKSWCEDKARLYPLTVTEAEKLYKRIWNRGIYSKKMFSIHPIRLDEEIKERYGEKVYSQNGLVEAEAIVKDSTESIFMPSTYLVEDVKVKSGLDVKVKEVVSYEGLYGGIFEEGEKIVVKGVLEKVESRVSKENYWRIVVGSLKADGKDYIKPKKF